MTAKDVGIPGIAPEDVPKLTPVQEAQLKAFQTEMTQGSKEEIFELYESEMMNALGLLAELQWKYKDKPATYANLRSLQDEATEKFAKLGLVVQVDWIISRLTNRRQPPQITIVDRLNEFNPEQNRFEVGRGVADDFYKAKREHLKATKRYTPPKVK